MFMFTLGSMLVTNRAGRMMIIAKRVQASTAMEDLASASTANIFTVDTNLSEISTSEMGHFASTSLATGEYGCSEITTH